MTTITIDRATVEQALEALEADNSKLWPSEKRAAAITALRSALAQQAEPVQDQRCRAEPRSDGDFVCDCKIGECLGRSAALAQKEEPLNLSDPVVQKRLASQWGYVPAAAQAEPVQEPVACSNTFACQCSKHFTSQQSEQRPKRVLTAVWRDRAQRAEAQRDALLEALKEVVPLLEEVLEITDDPEPGSIGHKARAAIAAVGGEKT